MAHLEFSPGDWKSVKVDGYEYDGIYEVNIYGEIFSIKSNKKLKPSQVKRGDQNISLTGSNRVRKKHLVHRIVACTFIDNPENKPFVNHKDRVPSNNNVSNLEWVTHKENMIHCIKSRRTPAKPVLQYQKVTTTEKIEGPIAPGKRRFAFKVVPGKLIREFPSVKDAANAVGVAATNIAACIRGSDGSHSAGGYVWAYKENQNQECEEGKILPNYSKYRICKDGRIYSIKYKKYMTPQTCLDYVKIKLSSDDGISQNHSIHRLVAMAYLPNDNPEVKIEVDHKDGNPLNNHVDNLEWVTPKENCRRTSARPNNRSKCVIKLDSSDNIIAEFESIIAASNDINESDWNLRPWIDTNKEFAGYKWRFKELLPDLNIHEPHN